MSSEGTADKGTDDLRAALYRLLHADQSIPHGPKFDRCWLIADRPQPWGRCYGGEAMTAIFDINDHAIAAGWATYHMDTPAHPHVHAPTPTPANGHSPSNYARCGCGVWIKWFVVGQHRYGSLSAEGSR